MPRIWSMMDVGRRSMANSQTALQTTAHNIANKTTDGYSRQRVEIKAAEPIGEGRVRIGQGATAALVTRTNDSYLEKQIEHESATGGFLNARGEMLGRVEQIYNEQNNSGLSHSIGQFFNAFRELSNNPESLSSRTQVKEAAVGLTNEFRHVHEQLGAVQGDADQQLTLKIAEVNRLTKEIASLNEKVQTVEMGGAPANDERDRRDLLIKQLGEKINIRWTEGKSGQVVITAGNTALLVSGFSHRDLAVISSPAAPGKPEGQYDIVYKNNDNSTPFIITKQINGGEIGGLLSLREGVVGGLSADLDGMSRSLAAEVNRVHKAGFDRAGRTGTAFFNEPEEGGNAAAGLTVNQDILDDVGRIAAAGTADAPGDNRVANLISGLEFKPVLDSGKSTIGDYYASIIGKVGIESQGGGSAAEAQKDVIAQLKNIRESISGVSLDEETTHMIEFQKAFEASARLIKTADEMIDTVLRLKPV